MSARQLREHVIAHRLNNRELTYVTKKCLQNVGGRLQPGARVGFVRLPGAASGAAAGQERGAGGELPPFPDFEPISDQQLKRFKLDRTHDGTQVVLRQRGEPPAATWHYVVPADDLDSFLLSLALGGLGINRAFDKVGDHACGLVTGAGCRADRDGASHCGAARLPCTPCIISQHCDPCTHCPCLQARNQFKVRLSDNPDGTTRWTGDGAEGLGKGGVKAWMKLDIVAADRRPLAPAAQPQTHPFVVNRVNEHWQARAADCWYSWCGGC